MNRSRLSSYDIRVFIEFGGDWGSVSSVIRLARDEAVDRLAAPLRLVRAMFLAALPAPALSPPRLRWRGGHHSTGPARGPLHALYARRSQTWLIAAASGVPVTP